MFKYLKYLVTFCILVACQKDQIPKESEEENFIKQNYTPGEENLIGKFSLDASSSSNAFNQAIPGLTISQIQFFGVGHAIANQSWVQAPSSTTTRDGLGPIFNANACGSCHPKDGRGRPMLVNNEPSRGFLIRLSQAGGKDIHGAPLPFPNYGGQLQNLVISTNSATSTVKKEADIHVSFKTIKGTYSDGEAYELRKPTYTIVNPQYGDISTALTSPRVGNQVIGLGFVDALSEQSILANADENDADGDGISGKANYIWDVVNKKLSIGKFGWKSNEPTLRQQISGALSGDMGITSDVFPKPNYDKPDWSKLPLPNGINPKDSVEIPTEQFGRLLLYQTALSVPVRRNYKDIEVLKGKKLFNKLACVKCHVNKFTTSKYDYLPILENVVIKPYSDFLLHDMGNALTDNRPFYLATANEWRTAPLWGIGMIKTVNNHTFLLHDGRARNIEEAILWHGGEAEKSKNDFTKISKTERTQLLKFLNSL